MPWHFLKLLQEDVAKRLIDQQLAPIVDNIPAHLTRLVAAAAHFSAFCHQHWHLLKEQARTDGKIFTPLIQLVTDFQGEAWLVRFMDGEIEKLQLKYETDGWAGGQVDFINPSAHIQRFGRLLF